MTKAIELNVGELFAGAGGLSLGFTLATHENVRFKPIFAIDNDASSVNSYRKNMQWLSQNASTLLENCPSVFNRDVEKLDIKVVERWLRFRKFKLNMLIGGPPCQGFSSSNKTNKKQSKIDKNRLVKIFLDKVRDFEPDMFLMENVQGIQWTEPTQDMETNVTQQSLFPDYEPLPHNVKDFLISTASSLGYYVWHDVLDAADFGVPQHRMRFFLFAVKKDIVSDPKLVNLTPYLQQLKTQTQVTVGEAIGDLPSLNNGENWVGNHYKPENNEYINRIRRFMVNGELHDHVTTKHEDYVIDRYKQIKQGENWRAIKNLMSNYKNVDKTHSNIYRRLKNDAPANTISHYRKSMVIHPVQNRGLSFREACRLQSFPDWFRFQGLSNARQQQLANAVPPLMAAKVAYAIGDCWTRIVNA